MKKILIFLGTITLIGTSTTSLVACNTPQKYTKEELEHLKEENKINTTNQQIKDNLEWIAPQEKSFKIDDNKYYFVVWRGDKNANWKIIKFKNINFSEKRKVLDKQNSSELALIRTVDLFVWKKDSVLWKNDNGTYFKSVYCWNLDTQEPDLIVDTNGNVKVN